jgi:hypothetical protein
MTSLTDLLQSSAAVGPLPREQRTPVEEFKAITKYL